MARQSVRSALLILLILTPTALEEGAEDEDRSECDQRHRSEREIQRVEIPETTRDETRSDEDPESLERHIECLPRWLRSELGETSRPRRQDVDSS